MQSLNNKVSIKLDRLDKRIIQALQRDGRLANNELARQIGLSPSSCLRRVRLLEEAGIIRHYAAIVDSNKVGLPFSMFARVWLVGQDAETIDRFIEAMKELPQVVECYIILGECDALLKVLMPDLLSYRTFQSTHLTKKNGILSVKTDLPSQIIKQSQEYPI